MQKIRIKIISSLTAVGLLWSLAPAFAGAAFVGGELIKGPTDTVYYVGYNLKRYVFPSERVYTTWYDSFDEVVSVSVEELNALPLAGVVRFKPGVRMIKVPDDPKVYTVGAGGLVRHVQDEIIAAALYGPAWNTYIEDVPASLFVGNYRFGSVIEDAAQYDPQAQRLSATSISADFGLQEPAIAEAPTEPAPTPQSTEELEAEQPVSDTSAALITPRAVSDIVFAPSDTNTVYFSSIDSSVGVWKSVDAGITWSQILTEVSVSALAVDPSSSSTVFIVNDGVLRRSADGGKAWEKVVVTDESGFNAQTVAFGWKDSKNVYTASTNALYKSTDGGAVWQSMSQSPADAWFFTDVLRVHPTDDKLVFAGSTQGLQKSSNSGQTWVEYKPTSDTFVTIKGFDFSRTDPETMYLITDRGLWYTVDNGASWLSARIGDAENSELRRIEIADSDANILYATTARGLYRSIDRGVVWTAISGTFTLSDVQALAVKPDDDDTAITGTTQRTEAHVGEGIYRTPEAGASWAFTFELTPATTGQ